MTKKIRSASIACVLATLALAGCGGGSSGVTGSTLPDGGQPPTNPTPPAPTPPAPVAIQGIATPSSVAVVTATNVN